MLRLLLTAFVLCCLAPSAIAQTTAPAAPPRSALSAAQIPVIFPGMFTQGTPAARYETPVGAQRLELRAATGERIEALFGPASLQPGQTPAHYPTALYFYGNGQCLAAALDEVALLRHCGANVLLADYLGYGLSEGRPSETGCYAVATALHDHALSRTDTDPARIVSAGWSLGAAVAIDLAGRRNVSGLVTFSAYTSKRELARRQFPNMAPEALEHPFLSIDKIGGIRCPTLIIHGRRDTLVPFVMSDQLRQAAGGRPLFYLAIDSAGHNDLFLRGEKQIERALRSFFEQVKPLSAPSTRPG